MRRALVLAYVLHCGAHGYQEPFVGNAERAASMGRAFFAIVFVIQLVVLNVLVFYFGGVKRFGTPNDFYTEQRELVQGRSDSLRQSELEVVAPENAGDSTLYDLGNHSRLFEQTESNEKRIQYLQAMIDSLEREKASLENIRTAITRKEEILKSVQQQARSENLGGLARMFEAMRPQEAIPVMLEINDSLAVNILSRMQSRNSAKLLGALAKADTSKAVRLSRLLATMGTLGGQ